MDTGKHSNFAVLIYLFSLLFFSGVNLINKVDMLDLVYLTIVLCSIFKYLTIISFNEIN